MLAAVFGTVIDVPQSQAPYKVRSSLRAVPSTHLPVKSSLVYQPLNLQFSCLVVNSFSWSYSVPLS